MTRKYDVSLLQALKEKETKIKYMGCDVLVKNLPDCDEPGAMDPRLYQDMKKQLKMMALVPSGMMKMDVSEKGIRKLREMFNGIKSIPTVEETIIIEHKTVSAQDGYDIPIRIYHKEEDQENAPILYYIHGGGFFGGSPDVVEESVKLLVANTNICAVSVDYRLAPEHPYPIGHQDCYTVLKWVYEHAQELHGDATNIFVGGDSAGGNLTQYCTTRDIEDGSHMVKGQLLLYPTLNMARVEDAYYHPSMDQFETTSKQRKGLKKMIGMFADMSNGLEDILKTKDVQNVYLNPYSFDPSKNPPTFLTVGEHDFLKIETLGYAAKMHKAGVETKVVLYKGFGHAFFDNTGVYPQCEDCIQEMGNFILEHSK